MVKKSQLLSITCMLRTKVVIKPACKRCEMVLVLYDNLERQIVVITHTSEMYGRSSEHLKVSYVVRVQSPHKR